MRYDDFIKTRICDEGDSGFIILVIPVFGWFLGILLFGVTYPILYYFKYRKL